MSKTKKEVKELTKIAGILTEIRNHEDAVDALVEELEDTAGTDKGTKHREFCQAYVIIIVREFCSTDDDAELMLAAYGLLKGFEFESRGLTKRLTAYWEYSRGYNQLFKNTNTLKSVPKTVSDNVERIIEYLDKKITARLSDDNKKLGFLDKVPDKLELPTPRSSKDQPLFPDALIANSSGSTPKDNTQLEPPKPPQKTDERLVSKIMSMFPKLDKILMFISAGSLVVAGILFIWMVADRDDKDFIASTADLESVNDNLENQNSDGEKIVSNEEYLENENENVTSSEERQEFQDELMNNIQNRIVNIDEPEKYNVEMAYEAIMVAIINNPVMGDMTARGLRDLELYGTNQTIGDIAPWLDEFIEETDKAMERSKHPKGMERWLVYKKGDGNEASLSDEYFVYAASICNFLDSSTIIGVREWESVENWHLVREGVANSSRRAERNPEQVTHQALVFQFTDTEGNVRALFGFSTLDLRFIVYDPDRDYE